MSGLPGTTGNELAMGDCLPEVALERVFLSARTANKFQSRPVDDATLRRLYELYKWGPTSMNCQPARVVFVRSVTAKQKLKAALLPLNVEKTMAAPVTAILAYDTAFYDQLPSQFPAVPVRSLFADAPQLVAETAMRNSSLQGAYLIVAARMLGLAAGPMSGFNADKLNTTFFADARWRANFLINLGWSDSSGDRPRGPRLPFEAAVRIE